MFKYILKRFLMVIPVIIGVSFLVYFIISLTPGDPVKMMLGEEASEESIQEVRDELGLDKPIIVQYFKYISKLVRGDLGVSYRSKRPVLGEIVARFPITLKLTFWSMLVAIIIAVPLGIISATKQYTLTDSICSVAALIGAAVPNFWYGLMLIIWFSSGLGWFPSGGSEGIKSMVLPSITLGTTAAAIITRMTRSSMLEVVRQDYIRTAKAKGVNKKVVIRKHALRNALIPIVTVVGLQFGHMLGGMVLTETVFSIPGMGRLMVDSIKSKDTPMVLGCIITLATVFSLVNLCIDILYAFIDPRIKSVYK
ncbi:MAG: ABC transporter permease [Tissierellia bacterium]|nr:ABC transporter permease [Tissierellia bacterium]